MKHILQYIQLIRRCYVRTRHDDNKRFFSKRHLLIEDMKTMFLCWDEANPVPHYAHVFRCQVCHKITVIR